MNLQIGKLYELVGFNNSNAVLSLKKENGLSYLLLNDSKPNVALVLGMKHYRDIMSDTPNYTYTISAEFQNWVQILYNDKIHYVTKEELEEIL